MFWPETSSANFYKATENSNSDSTKNHHSDHFLPRRFALDEPNNKRPEPCKGHIYFSLTATGVHSKSEKIRSVGNPETRIFGPGNRLSQDGSNFTIEKIKSLTQKCRNLMENPKPTLWEITSLIGSLCSTTQAVMPAFLQTI